MKAELVAPCGMNCNLCSAYLAYSTGLPKKRGKISHCEGCLPRKKKCAYLKGDCPKIRNGEIRFCYECATFPCERLKKIDARYRMNYGVSFIDNLREIKRKGVDSFLRNQEKAFACERCGGVKSVHNRKCYQCESITSWKG
jgi:hypothetical protein